MSGQNVQRPLDALGKSVDSPVLIKLKEIVNLEVYLRALIYT